VDSASIPLSFYVQYFVGSIIFARNNQLTKGSKLSLLFRSLKYLSVLWGSSLPFVAATIYFFKASSLAPPFKIEVIHVHQLWGAVIGTPGHIALAAALVMPFVLVFVYAHGRVGWVLVPPLMFGSMLAIVLPLQTFGDTVGRKLFFAKLQLMLASSLRLATLEYSGKGGTRPWHSRIPATLAMIVVIISRVIAAKQELSKSPFRGGKAV
jgi:hypothetical protein